MTNGVDEMVKPNLPNELFDFFDNKVGRSLIVKGEAGTGKTIFCLTLLEELGKIDNSFYISTRVSHKSLYSQFPWLRERDMRENLIDASIDFLRILYPVSDFIRNGNHDDVAELEKLEKARDVIKKMPSGDVEPELPESVSRAHLVSLAKEQDVRELQDIYKRVDTRLPEPSLIIIDSLESLIERYRVNPTELIKALQKDLVEMSGVRLVIVLEESKSTKWDYLVDGVISIMEVEERGRRLRHIVLNKLRGIQINRPVYQFTLNNGKFRYFKPFSFVIPRFSNSHESVEDGEVSSYHEKGLYSTGNIQLDKILHGGYPRKSLALFDIEENVPFSGQMHLFGPVIENFLTQGRGVLVMLSSKHSIDILHKWVNELFTVRQRENINILNLERESIGKLGQTISVKYEHALKEAYSELKFATGNHILTISDWIGIEHAICGKDVGRTERIDISLRLMQLMIDNSDLTIGLMGPGLSSCEEQRYISDVHLKLYTRYNSLFIHGEKPNTNIFNINLTDEEHPMTIFIPSV